MGATANTLGKFTSRGKQRAVLKAFAQTGRIIEACQKVRVRHEQHYRWMKSDEKYVQDFELAKEMVSDKLADEIFRRAHDGIEEPVGWHKGEPGGFVKRYSDNLAMFRMKALRPDEYRENYKVDVNTQHTVTFDDARTKLMAMIERNPNLVNKLGEMLGSRADVVLGAVRGGGDPPTDVPCESIVPSLTPAEVSPEITHTPSGVEVYGKSEVERNGVIEDMRSLNALKHKALIECGKKPKGPRKPKVVDTSGNNYLARRASKLERIKDMRARIAKG